jgi:hypothetical protein
VFYPFSHGIYLTNHSPPTGQILIEWTSSFLVNSNNFGSVQLLTPTENGVQLTPTSSLVTFYPSSIIIPAGGSFASFVYVGTSVGQELVSWEVNGLDADLYTTPDPTTIYVDPRMLREQE